MENLDKLLGKLTEYLTASEQVIQEHSDAAVDLGLVALRIDALSELVPGFIAFAIALISFKLMRVAYREHKKIVDWESIEDEAEQEKYRKKYNGNNETDAGVICGIFTAIGIICILIIVFSLFDIWAWAGVFYPELWAVNLALFK